MVTVLPAAKKALLIHRKDEEGASLNGIILEIHAAWINQYTALGMEPPPLLVVTGKEDFEKYAGGDWTRWEQECFRRIDRMTGKKVYDLVVFSGTLLGKASGSVAALALGFTRPYVLVTKGVASLKRIDSITMIDPDNYANMYELQVAR